MLVDGSIGITVGAFQYSIYQLLMHTYYLAIRCQVSRYRVLDISASHNVALSSIVLLVGENWGLGICPAWRFVQVSKHSVPRSLMAAGQAAALTLI